MQFAGTLRSNAQRRVGILYLMGGIFGCIVGWNIGAVGVGVADSRLDFEVQALHLRLASIANGEFEGVGSERHLAHEDWLGRDGGFLGDTVFERNVGGGMGEGAVLTVTGSGVASNLLIRGDASTYNGGWTGYFNGLVFVSGKAILTHSRIIGNGTPDRYGLPVVTVSGNAILRNCLIADNIGRGFFTGRGSIPQTAGFFQGFGSPVTENCTIAFNRSSSDDVPTVCIQQGIVRNSIFFGNFREGTASHDYANVTSNATFTNNLVDLTVAVDKGGWQGDPCFKNVARQDYRLSRASPAIDKGMFFPWMEGAVDLIGKPRLHRAPDLGCFEAFLEGLFFRLR